MFSSSLPATAEMKNDTDLYISLWKYEMFKHTHMQGWSKISQKVIQAIKNQNSEQSLICTIELEHFHGNRIVWLGATVNI